MPSNQPVRLCKSRLWLIPVLIFTGLFILWLTFTPAGITGKLQALGYAVCEQDPTHTLALGGRLLPLCSRCTGMYLGALVAIAFLSGNGRASRFPSKGKIVLLAVFLLAFMVDGLNSTAAELWPSAALYTPNNILRLASGLGMGVIIANLLLPLWNQTYWAESSDQPVLNSWRQLAILFLLETAAGAALLSGWSWLYFPAALLATGMVPLLLGMVYTLLWMLVFHRENLIRKWNEGMLYIATGAIAALIQIGLLDWIRYLVTGTWQAFHF